MTKVSCESISVPDYTRVGFDEESMASMPAVEAAAMVERFQGQLRDRGILALGISACVTASCQHGRISFNYPLLGHIDFVAPVHIPPRARLKICGDTCASMGVPIGLHVTLYIDDHAVWNGMAWGYC